MTLDQIIALTASGESETLELNETTGTRWEAAMTVCVFLNQGGGRTVAKRLSCKRYMLLTAAARYHEHIAGRKVTPHD